MKPLVVPLVYDHRHEIPDPRNIKRALCLDKIGPREAFLGNFQHVKWHRISKRVRGGSEKKVRLHERCLRSRTKFHAGIHVPLPDFVEHLNYVHRIHVVHRFAGRVISHVDVIPRHCEHVPDAQCVRSDQIRLQRQPVAVPCGHLEHRFAPLLHQIRADSKAADLDRGRRVVGDVDRIRDLTKQLKFLANYRQIRHTRRNNFRRDGKFPIPQYPLKSARAWPGNGGDLCI
ncbi:MAG: hypothetical protein BWY06_01663 [Candidatus Latescibacteria bacterium ADurb.Bin168]|nr:MAG: hypothetical protein BWY06_01663 [Candidatus Latescibacteria bacterium ADurb.Bin168]